MYVHIGAMTLGIIFIPAWFCEIHLIAVVILVFYHGYQLSEYFKVCILLFFFVFAVRLCKNRHAFVCLLCFVYFFFNLYCVFDFFVKGTKSRIMEYFEIHIDWCNIMAL